MAESLDSSAKAGKPSTTKTRRGAGSGLAVPVIRPEEAVQILGSALAYCLQSGLVVRRVNSPDGLVLVIGGVQYDSETADLRLVAPEAARVP